MTSTLVSSKVRRLAANPYSFLIKSKVYKPWEESSKKGRRGRSMTWNLHSISSIALRRSHGDNRPVAHYESHGDNCLSQVVPDVPPDTADAISRGGGGDFLNPGRWGTPSEAIQKAAAIHKSTEIPNDIDALVDLTTSLQSVRS
ncbi:hypothetical protein GW17_00000158 [Ensete ventricosum]|nr:hypothetical protein GW17_00000158 [Ensete ventricosum]